MGILITMSMDAAASNNLRLGNNSQIKLTSFKGGIKREDLKNDKMKTIFDKVDNGDGVLTDAEIAKFKADIQAAAKNEKLSKGEAKEYLKSGDKPVDTKEISGKDMMAFLQEVETLSEASKVEKAEEVTTEDGKTNVVLTSDGGNTVETIHTDDKTSTVCKKDEENKTETTENYDANHNITSSEVVDSSDAENVKTTLTEYNTAEAGETPTEKTITVRSNGYESVTECDENGNPTVKTETNEQDKTKTTTEFQPAVEGQEPKAKKVSVQGEGYNSETTFDEQGQPQSKHEVKGTVTSDYSYVDGNERLDRKVEDKGNGVTAESTYEYTDKDNYKETRVEAGKTTVTTFEDGKKSTIQDENSFTQITYDEGGRTEITTETNGNVTVNELNTDGNRTKQTKVIDGKERTMTYDGKGNTTGIVVQNGESPESLARKFGCSVEELKELNKDVLGGKKYFDVGAEITVPGEIEADSPVLKGRKSADEAKADFAADQERAEIARAQKQAAAAAQEARYKAMGLKNHNGAGKPISGKYSNGRQEQFTIIGESGNGRHLAKSKDGKFVTISHDGKILKEEYVQMTNLYSNGKKIQGQVKVKGKDGTVTTETRSYVKIADMPKGRSVVIDSKGRQYVMSHDGKILDSNYIQRDAQADVISRDKNAAKAATLDILDGQLDSAVDAFNQQMAQDGWAGDTADFVSKAWNNDWFLGGALNTRNTASQVRADLLEYKNNLAKLKSLKDKPEEFNTKFQQIYGVPYNETAVANYVRNPSVANYRKAFGTKNDIGLRVAKYNESQQTGAEVVKTTAKVGVVAAATVATGGAGGVAAAAALTAGASVVVEETDRAQITGGYTDAFGNKVKTNGAFKEGTDHGAIFKGAMEDGAMVLVGGGIAKGVGTAVKGASMGARVTRGTLNVAGDVGAGAGREYVDTGNVTLSGTLANAASAAVGSAVGSGVVKNIGKKVSNTVKSGYSKGKSAISNLAGRKPKVTPEVTTSTPTPAPAPKTKISSRANESVTTQTSGSQSEPNTRIRRNHEFEAEPNTSIKPANENVTPVKTSNADPVTQPSLEGSQATRTSNSAPETKTSTHETDGTKKSIKERIFNSHNNTPKTRLADDASNFDEVLKDMDKVTNMSELNEYVSLTQHRGLNSIQRRQLQNSLRANKKRLMEAANTPNANTASGDIKNTVGIRKTTGFNDSYEVAPNAKLKLADEYQLDLKSPDVKSKINAMEEGDKLIVGRSEDADIPVPSTATGVSREHLVIEKRNGKIVVTDISTNGSEVRNRMSRLAALAANKTVKTDSKKIVENLVENEVEQVMDDDDKNNDKLV